MKTIFVDDDGQEIMFDVAMAATAVSIAAEILQRDFRVMMHELFWSQVAIVALLERCNVLGKRLGIYGYNDLTIVN